jgi:hypothetical protein
LVLSTEAIDCGTSELALFSDFSENRRLLHPVNKARTINVQNIFMVICYRDAH